MGSAFQKKKIAMIARTPIRNFLQHLAYNPATQVYQLEDNKVGFCFEISPMIYANDETGDQLKTVLNRPSLPDSSMVSFSLWAGQDISEVVAQSAMIRAQLFRETGNSDVDNILKSLSKQHMDFLQAGTSKPVESVNRSRVRNIRGFVSVVIQEQKKGTKKKPRSLNADDVYRDLINEFQEGLSAAGLNPVVLVPSRLRKLLSSIINWSPNANWRNPEDYYDDDTPIRDQVVDMDTDLQPKFGREFRMGDRFCSVLSAERLPSQVSLRDCYEYIMDSRTHGAGGIKENVLITANIFYDDKKKETKSIGYNRWWSNQSAGGKLAQRMPILKKISDSYDLLFDSVEDGDRPCRVAFHIAVFGDNEDRVMQEAANVETRFSSLRYRMKQEKQISVPVFFSMLPMNADPDPQIVNLIGRYKTCTTKHAVRLLPISSEWKGAGSPVSTFVGRSGQILPYNPFDNSTNYNQLICAASGSGKSVAGNVLISDVMSCGGKAIIMDQGGSYENTCEIFDGEYITFSPDKCPNLNPFLFISDYESEKDMLVGLLAAMAKINPAREAGVFQLAQLRSLLDEAWNAKGRQMMVDDIVQLAAEFEDTRVSDLAVQLKPYTLRGEYGRYYSSEDAKPIDFDAARLIVLELDDLKDKEDLLQVVVLQLIIMTNRYIYNKHRNGDTSWTLMLIDEAWKFMTAGSADIDSNPILRFILTAYRQFRKHMASIALITQSLQDVYQTAAGVAIAENAGNRLFLGQNGDVIKRLIKENKLELSPFWEKQLLSVRTIKGRFSEIFFQTSDSMGVGRLILSPFTLLLFSTNAKDRGAVKFYKDQGYSTVDAVWKVLADRGEVPKVSRV